MKYSSDRVALFHVFYEDITNSKLREIFAILHANFNYLFSFMNDKMDSNRHYNADPSRDLKELVQYTKVLHANLKEEYAFEINEYYEDVINKCASFLSSSGGSTIPEDFPPIEIIEHQPIFTLANTLTVAGVTQNASVNLRFIGEGSYANVFKYKDPQYNVDFALKRAKEGLRPDELQRFKNEFNDLNTLSSPFIVKAYSYNDDKNEYAMEYVDETLSKYIARSNQKLTFEKRRILVEQLLRAFIYIHSTGILHRDISYTNILIKHFGDGSIYLKVSDFGLVKRPNSSLTRQGTEIKGAINDYTDLTAIGFENYEIRHETYALAKVIYFILSGRTSNYHLEKNGALKTFILRAISPNKEERFTSVEEMKQELYMTVYPTLRKN